MKIEELRKKTKEELRKMFEDSGEKLGQLKFDLASGKVKNITEIRRLKKEIARILTTLRINNS